MPFVAGLGGTDPFAFYLAVGQHQHFRVVIHLVFGRDMDIQPAEVGTEYLLLFRGELLAADRDYLVGKQRVQNGAESIVIQTGGNVDSGDFRPEGCRKR